MDVRPPSPATPDTTRAIKRAMRTAELAPASWRTQLAAYLVVVLALGLWFAWTGHSATLGMCAVALGAGVAVGRITPAGSWFVNVSGVVAAVTAAAVCATLLGLTDGRLLGDEPWLAPLLVGLVVLGVDWGYAPRLRARAVASGLLVLPFLGVGEAWGYWGAAAWFAGLVGTLWSVEQDAAAAALQPVPLTERRPPRLAPAAFDLLRVAALGAIVGLAAAALLGEAACSLRDERSTRFDTSSTGLRADGRSQGRASPYGSVITGSDAAGRQYQYYVDELGRQHSLYVIEPDGSRSVPGRDGAGTVRRPDGDASVVIRDSDGTTRTYDRDHEGRDRVRIERGGRTRTFVYEQSDGELDVTAYDERGTVIERFTFDGGGAQRFGASGRAEDAGRAEQSTSDERSDRTLWLVAGLIALVLAVALGVLLLWRHRARRAHGDAALSWAERVSRRLAAEGAARGHARARSQTVMEHTVALARGPMPDGRLPSVGRILSSALFGRHVPSAEEQRWVETVVDEAAASHPPPTNDRRRRRRHDAAR